MVCLNILRQTHQLHQHTHVDCLQHAMRLGSSSSHREFPRAFSWWMDGHGTQFISSRPFPCGLVSQQIAQWAGFPPHPSQSHRHVSGPLYSRVPDRRYDPRWRDLTGFFHALMLPAARCSIPTARALKVIASACNSGIRQPAATRQAIILSLTVAVDVVASMLPEKVEMQYGSSHRCQLNPAKEKLAPALVVGSGPLRW